MWQADTVSSTSIVYSYESIVGQIEQFTVEEACCYTSTVLYSIGFSECMLYESYSHFWLLISMNLPIHTHRTHPLLSVPPFTHYIFGLDETS
jgi:protoporphyrinogen oxidase